MLGECCLSWSTCILLDLMGHTGFIYHLSFAWHKDGETWDERGKRHSGMESLDGYFLTPKTGWLLWSITFNQTISKEYRSLLTYHTYFLLWKFFFCMEWSEKNLTDVFYRCWMWANKMCLLHSAGHSKVVEQHDLFAYHEQIAIVMFCKLFS